MEITLQISHSTNPPGGYADRSDGFVFPGCILAPIYELQTGVEGSLRHRLENIAALAGLQQDGDTFVKVQAQGDENFNKIHTTNLKIKASEPDLRFVYTMRKENGQIYFVVDAGAGEFEISAYGDLYKEPSQTLIDNFDTMTGTIVERDFYTDEFDTLLSAYTPIFNASGKRVGVLGVDITAKTVLAQERKFLIRLILVFLASLL